MLMNAQQQTIVILIRIAATPLVHIHAHAEMDTLVVVPSVQALINLF